MLQALRILTLYVVSLFLLLRTVVGKHYPESNAGFAGILNPHDGASAEDQSSTTTTDLTHPAFQNEELTPTSSYSYSSVALPPPPPPQDLPLRFLNAGKGDVEEGWRRYKKTLQWRQEENIDTILREAYPDFVLIKQHYPHFYHLTGHNGQPVYYEQPAKTDLQALRDSSVTFPQLLRHYIMITEFQWQMLNRDDYMTSIFVIDLEGIRMRDFVGETVDFVKKMSTLAALHYPERAGQVFVVNVPRWFQLIWKVVKTIVDESTLRKIFILRGKEEILESLKQHVPFSHIPPEYGGGSAYKLGDAPEEVILANLMRHNLQLAKTGQPMCTSCHGIKNSQQWPCNFCSWTPARSY